MRERDIYLILERVPFIDYLNLPDANIYYMDAYSSWAAAKQEAKRLKEIKSDNDYFVTPIVFKDDE